MKDTVDGRNPKQPPDMYERNPVKYWDIYHVNWLAGFFPSTVSFIFCQVKMVFPRRGTGILMDVFFRSRRRNWNTERSPQNFPGTVSFASSSSHIPFLGSSENRRLKSTQLVGDMWSLVEDIQYTNLSRLHREIWGFYTVVSLWYCSCGWLRWWIGLTRLSMPPFSLTSLCKYYRKHAKHEKCEKKTATSFKLSNQWPSMNFTRGFQIVVCQFSAFFFKYLLVSFYFLHGGRGRRNGMHTQI